MRVLGRTLMDLVGLLWSRPLPLARGPASVTERAREDVFARGVGGPVGITRPVGTDPEMARAGARELDRLLTAFEPATQLRVLSEPGGALFRAATGVGPVSLGTFEGPDVALLARAVLADHPNFHTWHVTTPNPGHHTAAFANLTAAGRVAEAFPDVFPRRAGHDLQASLQELPWLVQASPAEQRAMGLASGFPARSVDAFRLYQRALGVLSDGAREAFDRVEGPTHDAERAAIARELREGGHFTDGEIALVLARRPYDLLVPLHYWSFHPDDAAYDAELGRCLRAGLLELRAETRAALCAADPSLAAQLRSN